MTTSTVTDLLDLLAQVGIRVTRSEDGISDEFADLASCRKYDIPGQHEGHADALVLWFEGEDDLMALQELTYNAEEDEFGCDWPSVAPQGVRGMVASGPYARAVVREDIPALVDLLRREMAGEFAHTTPQRRAVRRARIGKAIAVFGVVMSLAAIWRGVSDVATWLFLLIEIALFVWWTHRADMVAPPREHLNRVRPEAVTS